VLEKKTRSAIEITLVAFEAPTIIPAEHNEPKSTKNIPRMSSISQFGPKQIDKPKKANIKANNLNGFIGCLSIKKFITSTQKGKVKNSNTLRLTGIYLYEPKYPKLIPTMKIPIIKTKKAIGLFIARKLCIILVERVSLYDQEDHMPINMHPANIRKKTTISGETPSS